MDDVYINIGGYNLNKKFKLLILFNFMIADMLSSKNFKQ